MDVLGSVKNRLKTMRIVNKNKKLKLEKQSNIKKEKKTVLNFETIKPSDTLNSTNIKTPTLKLKKVGVKIQKVKIENPKVEIILKKGIYKNDIKKTSENKVEKDVSLLDTKKISNADSIIDRFKLFIRDSKKEVKKLKNDLKREEEKIKKINTEKEIEDFEKRIKILKEKIDNLKCLYDNILEKYEFYGYSDINDNLLYKYIDDFKFNNSTSDIDLLVIECKSKIDYIEEINNLIVQVDKIKLKEQNKKSKIHYLDNDYYNRVVDYNKLLKMEEKINNYLFKEEEYLSNLEKEINNYSLESKKISHLIFDKKYINNLYKMNIGLSLLGTTYIGAFVGAFIIKNSLSPLISKAFKRKESKIFNYKYKEYIKKINDNLSIIKETTILLKDSLTEISNLKKYIENEYREYLNVKAYKELYEKIKKLEINLIQKYDNNLKLEEKMLEQKRKNNEKQKKLELLNKLNEKK